MPFWWHFREVPRASDRYQPRWKKADGTALSDDEQRDLIALSLLNYAVYTSMAEAISFHQELGYHLSRMMPEGTRILDARRTWKGMYSSLYSSFNALSNIVCIVVGQKPPYVVKKSGQIWNHTPGSAIDLMNGRGIKEIHDALSRIQKRLEIRDHLDHYWTIWITVRLGSFMLDRNFEKAYIALHPETEAQCDVDALSLATEHLVECSKDFNLIYEQLSITDGYLDQYIAARNWQIDNSDRGAPHNGKRPLP